MQGSVTLRIVGSPVRSGDTAYVESLHQQVERLGLQANVEFVGPIPYPELPHVYPEADLFLNFSDTGSLDKAVLEAMSCGVPVLTTNVAFRDMLRAIDARFFASNDLQEMVNSALSIINVNHNEYGRLSREIIKQRHSLGVLVNKIVEAYKH
jgi:glycosyltransferase involved in cell wall biosynthesis